MELQHVLEMWDVFNESPIAMDELLEVIEEAVARRKCRIIYPL